MRGEYAEFNPWQVPMGSITDACLRLCGFLVYRIEKAEDVDDVVPAACDISFDSNQSVAVILSQRLIGRKRWNN
jgi:sulfopyruvate decarboxylase TPP-binding subunit